MSRPLRHRNKQHKPKQKGTTPRKTAKPNTRQPTTWCHGDPCLQPGRPRMLLGAKTGDHRAGGRAVLRAEGQACVKIGIRTLKMVGGPFHFCLYQWWRPCFFERRKIKWLGVLSTPLFPTPSRFLGLRTMEGPKPLLGQEKRAAQHLLAWKGIKRPPTSPEVPIS